MRTRLSTPRKRVRLYWCFCWGTASEQHDGLNGQPSKPNQLTVGDIDIETYIALQRWRFKCDRSGMHLLFYHQREKRCRWDAREGTAPISLPRLEERFISRRSPQETDWPCHLYRRGVISVLLCHVLQPSGLKGSRGVEERQGSRSTSESKPSY